MIITTTNNIEKHDIKQYLGVVNANVVIGTNIFSDFAAALTDSWGGRSGTYQNKLGLIYKDVIAELQEKANKLNANAVLGLHIDFDEISGGGKSMFMVSASGTAVVLEREFQDDRYAMYKLLNDIYEYKSKGFLSDEEYEFEKESIITKYKSSITSEVQVFKELQQKKLEENKEIELRYEEARKTLKTKFPCSEEEIRSITKEQIQVADYSSISINTNESLTIIIAKLVRLNKIYEACKYYMDDTSLGYKDAIEFVLDVYKKADLIDKESFDRILKKIKVLKDKGFIEQAIKEYKQYTLVDDNAAKECISNL